MYRYVLYFRVFADIQSDLSLDSFLGLNYIPCLRFPNSHEIISFTDPYPLKSVLSYRYKNTGSRFAPTFRRSHSPADFDLSSFFSGSSALFCTSQKLNSFVFNQFCTLSQKSPGWGRSRSSISKIKRRGAPVDASQPSPVLSFGRNLELTTYD